MRRALGLLLMVLLGGATGALAQGAKTVSPQAALNHVGELATVCGRVASANFNRDKSLVVAIDDPYPGQSFSLLIQPIDRIKFGSPELSLLGKRLCATGPILLAQGRAQMILREPNQLAFE